MCPFVRKCQKLTYTYDIMSDNEENKKIHCGYALSYSISEKG